jgi:hypothetical protein
MRTMKVSERFACRVTGQNRSTQRRPPAATTPADPDAGLRAWLRAWAKDHPRRGFRLAHRGSVSVVECDVLRLRVQGRNQVHTRGFTEGIEMLLENKNAVIYGAGGTIGGVVFSMDSLMSSTTYATWQSLPFG